MESKNIFKMEMYKNRNDKPYLIVITILTVMAAIATFMTIGMTKGHIKSDGVLLVMLIMLIVFFIMGLSVFSLLYPFHLLNIDYKNKVISLIFASGVSREKYYFIKIGATILCCSLAMLTILFIPMLTFLVIYPEFFVEMMQQIIKSFSIAHILPVVLMTAFSVLAYYVTLTTSVIITKGKVAGIFLYFGFSFAVSTVSSGITFPILMGVDIMGDSINIFNQYLNINTLFSVVQIIIFALIGLAVLKRQDL